MSLHITWKANGHGAQNVLALSLGSNVRQNQPALLSYAGLEWL